MSEIYGNQFANQYGDVGGEAFQTWCLALQDLTTDMIAHGFRRLLERESKFVPNLNEFRKLCKPTPEDLGLPPVAKAYHEAAMKSHNPQRQWSHPAVYLAGKEAGWFELRGSSSRETQPRFERAYQDLCQRVLAGEKLELPEFNGHRIEFDPGGKKERTKQALGAGKSALAELKKNLGCGSNTEANP